jgi:ABC-type multidrug transport system permease subunit
VNEDNKYKHNDNDNDNNVKLEFKDIIAIIIAQFQILIPIVLIAALMFGVIFFLLTKFWMKV